MAVETPFSPVPGSGPQFHVIQATMLVNGVPTPVSIEAIALADEFGNLVLSSSEDGPWKQALLDEMRALRLGMQMLLEYIHPMSGITTPAPVSNLASSVVSTGVPNAQEVDLIALAQSIREDALTQEVD